MAVLLSTGVLVWISGHVSSQRERDWIRRNWEISTYRRQYWLAQELKFDNTFHSYGNVKRRRNFYSRSDSLYMVVIVVVKDICCFKIRWSTRSESCCKISTPRIARGRRLHEMPRKCLHSLVVYAVNVWTRNIITFPCFQANVYSSGYLQLQLTFCKAVDRISQQ